MIIDDPYEEQDPPGLRVPSRSPSPIVVRQSTIDANGYEEYEDRLEDDVDIEDLMKGKTEEEIQ